MKFISQVQLEEVIATVEGDRIRCWICDESDIVYRREKIDIAEKIVENGYFTPSDTNVFSVSANPHYTFGGPVRFVFNKNDMVCPVEPMCYVINPDEEDKYDKLKWEKEEYYTINYDKFFGDKFVNVSNLVDAEYGMTSESYIKECEHMAHCSVPISKVKKIEYWIGQTIGIRENVSCENLGTGYIDASGYMDWDDYKRDVLVGNVGRARRLAQMLGVPFEVDSCFSAIRVGHGMVAGDWAILDEENLRRIAEGKDLIITKIEKDLPFSGSDCLC